MCIFLKVNLTFIVCLFVSLTDWGVKIMIYFSEMVEVRRMSKAADKDIEYHREARLRNIRICEGHREVVFLQIFFF